MDIEIVGIPKSAIARLRLLPRTRAALTPASGAIRYCRVAFADENGPKGGVAVRCTIDVNLIRRAPIHVGGLGTSEALALRKALDRLHRRVDGVIGTGRDAARHPKKYFAALRAGSAPAAR